jgi:cobyric acid synthase
MVQGTSSGAGKSTLVIALCRILSDLGFRVCPFKAQNMSSKIFNISKSEVISNIQAVQAIAARNKPSWKINPILLIPVGIIEAGSLLRKILCRDDCLNTIKILSYRLASYGLGINKDFEKR